MKRVFLFTVLFFCTLGLTAQVTRTPVSVLYPSIGAYSSQFKDAFSFRSNTAALAGLKDFSAGVFSERRFLVEELSTYSFALAMPTSSGNFGVKGDYSGGQLYKEATLGFAYGRKLGEKAALGLGFNYVSLNASGYGSASALTFDAGAIFQLTDQLQIGIHAYNPVSMKMGKTGDEKLPPLFSVGLGYDVSPQFYLGTEIVKTEDQPLSVNAGFHYVFAEKLVAQGGISSATSVYYIGFGVQVKSFRVDATASFHPYLGTTPGLLFIYAPAK
ncbi:MAG: hypothetical protein EOO10_01855 [Chitinophagaceae bacterium]|nr:MAG: hypothetical protein EOO10_01855 [Chitinophagaceae bacterium]